MSFDLKKFIKDVFKPELNESVMILYDLPNGDITDTEEWKQRREMANDWHDQIIQFSNDLQIFVSPIVTYLSTGTHNGDLPKKVQVGGVEYDLEEIISAYGLEYFHFQHQAESTIESSTNYSASTGFPFAKTLLLLALSLLIIESLVYRLKS